MNDMFGNLIRTLKVSSIPTTVSIPIKADEDGYLDKQCPHEACSFQFKVNEQDWVSIFHDEQVFCPTCGKSSLSKDFFTKEQNEIAKQKVFDQFSAKIGNALVKDSANVNSTKSNGFITLSMKTTSQYTSEIIDPIEARSEIERKVTCTKCQARYAVIGSAFFCPACQFNDVEKCIDEALQKVWFKITNAERVKEMLYTVDPDQAVNTARDLIESSIRDLVTTFQRFCEKKYTCLPGAEKIKENIFQRVQEGSALWKRLVHEGYEDWIDTNEYNLLVTMFQKRHSLEHQTGIIDEKYIEKSNDPNYALGERLVVTQEDVQLFFDVIKKLINKIRSI